MSKKNKTFDPNAHYILVRDKEVDKLLDEGKVPITRTIDNEYIEYELKKKLKKVYYEYLKSEEREEKIDKLIDMFEIIKALVELESVSYNEFLEMTDEKANELGSFNERIYLKYTINM